MLKLPMVRPMWPNCFLGLPHWCHLSPVGSGVQRLPAVQVFGAQAGLVLQQQNCRLAEPTGSGDVKLEANDLS